jgi:hypothetical protein
MNRASNANAVRLARQMWNLIPSRTWDEATDDERRSWVDAAQALIDSPDWQITWTPPDPAEQIAEAYARAWEAAEQYGMQGRAAAIRRLLDDGIIQPGPALEADR